VQRYSWSGAALALESFYRGILEAASPATRGVI
jgi:hypothetical protein